MSHFQCGVGINTITTCVFRLTVCLAFSIRRHFPGSTVLLDDKTSPEYTIDEKNVPQKIKKNVKKRKQRDKNKKTWQKYKKKTFVNVEKNVISVIFRRTDKFEMLIGLI